MLFHDFITFFVGNLVFVECTKSVVLISKWIKLKIINEDSGEIFDKVKNKEQLHVAWYFSFGDRLYRILLPQLMVRNKGRGFDSG